MLALKLEEPVRLEMTEQLNQLLADDASRLVYELSLAGGWSDLLPIASALRQAYGEQVEMVDSIAERIQLLGAVSLAMAADVAETTQLERRRVAGKKFRFSCPGCSMLIK